MLFKLDRDQEQAEIRQKQMLDKPDMTMGQNEDYQKLDAEMSRRRINQMRTDYEMLSFCFSASAILFKEI